MNRSRLLAIALLMACGPMSSTSTRTTGRGSKTGAIISCPTTPARQVFTSGLCLCGDDQLTGSGITVSGPNARAGINGRLEVVGNQSFDSDLIAYQGVSGVGELRVAGSLSTAKQVEGVGHLVVGGDLNASLGVSSVGELEVHGTLHAPGAADVVGTASIGSVGPAVTLAGPPCACGAQQVLDVVAAVAAARAKNDNAVIGLSTRLDSVGDFSLALGSGSYFFDAFSTVGDAVINVDGAVALFVEGDFETVGSTRFVLTPGSTLDLYVTGAVQLVGDSTFDGAAAGAVRLYVGGPRGSVELVGAHTATASIYAPEVDLSLVGDTHFVGSVFARDLVGVGSLTIETGSQTVIDPNSDRCQPSGQIGIE